MEKKVQIGYFTRGIKNKKQKTHKVEKRNEDRDRKKFKKYKWKNYASKNKIILVLDLKLVMSNMNTFCWVMIIINLQAWKNVFAVSFEGVKCNAWYLYVVWEIIKHVANVDKKRHRPGSGPSKWCPNVISVSCIMVVNIRMLCNTFV